MNFGDDHNTAMGVRLRKCYFRKLNSPSISGVQKHLKQRAMDCIVWASGVARTPEDELPPPTPGTARENSDIDEEEKERIRTMNLEELSESDGELSEELINNNNNKLIYIALNRIILHSALQYYNDRRK